MKKILILTAPFYQELTQALCDEAVQILTKHSLPYERGDVAGAFELPIALAHHARAHKYKGAVVLGCVIRGTTDHYDHVCRIVADGVAQIAREELFPVGFGVVMANTMDEAKKCVFDKNYGARAAHALIKLMTNIKGNP